MSLKLLRLAFFITTFSAIRAHSQLHRTVATAVALMATRRRGTGRHYTTGISVVRTAYHVRHKGVLYDAVYSPEQITDAGGTSPVDGDPVTSASVEETTLSPTNVVSSTFPGTGPLLAATSTLLKGFSASSDASPKPSFVANLDVSQPQLLHQNMHPTIVPAVVGSAVGAVLLIVSALLVVSCRRRMRARETSQRSNKGIHRWFGSDEKDNIIFIRVPPPTVPLKSILIRNPSDFPPTPTDAYSDRMSLTSSQMSVVINNLPKSYDSGLEDGVLDEVRQDGRSSPIKVATRIGPSSSDFIANLFGLGRADSFSSDTSSASGESAEPPQAPHPPSQAPHPPSPAPPQPQPYSYDLPSLTPANPPTPTFPPAAASPTLSLASSHGPRGHGLVLTGDQPVPSFAQWHYQRTMARTRDGSPGFGFSPQF